MPRPTIDRQRIISRRAFIKKGGFAAIGFVALSMLPFYSYFMERRWMETTQVELAFRSLPERFDGMRIVHFSDVHFGFHYDERQLAPLIDEINGHQPDLIVFTGDMFDGPVLPYSDACVKELKRLNAPLGKFAVPGNHDYYTGKKLALQAYAESGFLTLINQSTTIRAGAASISIVGLDDMLLGNPDVNAAFSGVSSEQFTLLLAHEPDFATRTSSYRVDLQLSGHSHGGQVSIPPFGSPLLPRGARLYPKGLYKLDDREIDSYVYTNRGIGTTHIPIRFLCRPELTIITLRQH